VVVIVVAHDVDYWLLQWTSIVAALQQHGSAINRVPKQQKVVVDDIDLQGDGLTSTPISGLLESRTTKMIPHPHKFR